MENRERPHFPVSSETTAKVNEDWESLKRIKEDMYRLMISFQDTKIPLLKNKIYNLFWEIDSFTTFYMSPFPNFITAYGYYFDISDVRRYDQRESKLVVSKELVPIPDNWRMSHSWGKNEWVYPDSGNWKYGPDGNYQTVNIDTPEEFNSGIRCRDNRSCNVEWTEEEKQETIDVIQRYINFCNIDYLQYAMDHTCGWSKRKDRIKQANRLIQLISN
jgi:hypothetical protein